MLSRSRGDDPSLRAADISFAGQRYARTEIVKASSALSAADGVIQQLRLEGLLPNINEAKQPLEHQFPFTSSLSQAKVITKAETLATERGYPPALAHLVRFDT